MITQRFHPKAQFSELIVWQPSTVISSHQSHGSAATQRSQLVSDSVKPSPLCLMSHEFTLLTPLLASRSPYLPPLLYRHRGMQGRNAENFSRLLCKVHLSTGRLTALLPVQWSHGERCTYVCVSWLRLLKLTHTCTLFYILTMNPTDKKEGHQHNALHTNKATLRKDDNNCNLPDTFWFVCFNFLNQKGWKV